jgi:hypothetical protein
MPQQVLEADGRQAPNAPLVGRGVAGVEKVGRLDQDDAVAVDSCADEERAIGPVGRRQVVALVGGALEPAACLVVLGVRARQTTRLGLHAPHVCCELLPAPMRLAWFEEAHLVPRGCTESISLRHIGPFTTNTARTTIPRSQNTPKTEMIRTMDAAAAALTVVDRWPS